MDWQLALGIFIGALLGEILWSFARGLLGLS